MTALVDERGRPLPVPSDLTRPFWDALRERRLVLQHCPACGGYQHAPKLRCTTCRSTELVWREVAGTGRVHSHTTVHRPPSPAFADAVPYVVAIVELDGTGVRMLSNVVGVPPDDVYIGQKVRVVFDDVADEFTVFRFEPAEES
ncbi:Zn-ribbon domain-containing OB-fold protein [Actinophytocola sp.]|uniref:Zn-ribbon domain-containing OB-fold protein n=1 Tax=Actinophytocola sp. TaxID=1872138 RepID=UPI003D6C12C2